MKAIPVKAHKIASIGGARSSDGEYGLIRLVRDTPMPDGNSDVWVAVPKKLLPYLASVAVKQLPQPTGTGASRNIPHALDAKQVAVGVAPSGQVILSLLIDQGAALSYRLSAGQARQVLDILQAALGEKDGAAPKANSKAKAKPAAKPKARKPN